MNYLKKKKLRDRKMGHRHEVIDKVLKVWLTSKQYELSYDWHHAFAEALAIEMLIAAKKNGVNELLVEESWSKRSRKIIQPGDEQFVPLSILGRNGILGSDIKNILNTSRTRPKVQPEKINYRTKVDIVEDNVPLEELKSVPLTEKNIMVDP
jgi:hypothetical protein